jgi:DnaK suppressor protein
MSDERYRRLKELLEAHKHRLQNSLRTRLNEVRAHGHDGKGFEALDAADASSADLEQYFGTALAELAAQALRQVDQALARLECGDYGLCRDCNEKISHKRLTAVPFALRCRACEELREAGERARGASARSDDSVIAYEGRLQRIGTQPWE